MNTNTPNPAGSNQSTVTGNQRDEYVLRRLEEVVGNAMSMRSNFLQSMFDPRRNLDDECGWPQSEGGLGSGGYILSSEFYRTLYDREAIANRVVELMPQECWQQAPIVYEEEDPTKITAFELAFDQLGKKLRGAGSYYVGDLGNPLWDYLKRANIRAGIGRFGIILLGFDDGKRLDQPVDGVMQTTPVKNVDSEGKAHIVTNEQGQPLTYNYNNGYLSIPSEEIKEYVTYTINNKTGFPEPTGKKQYQESEIKYDVNNQKYTHNISVSRQPTSTARTASGQSVVDSFMQGTDAQYMGVQLGPTEYPSNKPADEPRQLLYLRIFDESLVQIVQYEANAANPRFGMPVMYRVTLNDPHDSAIGGIGLPLATVTVHWSRVIHITREGLGSSAVASPPVMRPVLNRILDLRKILGASAEGFYRSCFSILSWETHPQLGGDVEVDENKFKDRVEQLMNGLQRTILNKGMSLKSVAPQVVDPTSQINVQIEQICIQKACPVRIFKGSERGELASSQDDESWNERKMEYQNNYITPHIIIIFIDRMIQAGVLPVPDGTIVGQTGDDSATPEGDDNAAQDDEGNVNGSQAQGNQNGQSASTAKAASKSPAFPPKPSINRLFDSGSVSNYRMEQYQSYPVYNANGTQIGVTTKDDDGNGYTVEWPDLESLNKKDKATIALTKTQAIQAFVQGGCEAIMPVSIFYTNVMGMDDEEAQSIIDQAKSAHEDQDTMSIPPQIQGQPAAPPPGTAAKQQQDQKAQQAKQQAAALAKGGAQAGAPGQPKTGAPSPFGDQPSGQPPTNAPKAGPPQGKGTPFK